MDMDVAREGWTWMYHGQEPQTLRNRLVVRSGCDEVHLDQLFYARDHVPRECSLNVNSHLPCALGPGLILTWARLSHGATFSA